MLIVTFFLPKHFLKGGQADSCLNTVFHWIAKQFINDPDNTPTLYSVPLKTNQKRQITRINKNTALLCVVRRLDNALHRINQNPVDSVMTFVNAYPLGSDLSGSQCYPTFQTTGACKRRWTTVKVQQDLKHKDTNIDFYQHCTQEHDNYTCREQKLNLM